MKKFISMVMAAAMVASLVPATAFAKGEVTASVKVVDALTLTRDEASDNPYIVEDTTSITGAPTAGNTNDTYYQNRVPEGQMTIKTTDYRRTEDGGMPTLDVTVSLDNATFKKENGDAPDKASLEDLVSIRYASDRGGSVEKGFVPGAATGAGSVGDENATGNVIYDPTAKKEIVGSITDDLPAIVGGIAGIEWIMADPATATPKGDGMGETFTVTVPSSEEVYYLADKTAAATTAVKVAGDTGLVGTTDAEFLDMLEAVLVDTTALFLYDNTDVAHTVSIGNGSATHTMKVELDNAAGTPTAVTAATLAASDTTFAVTTQNRIHAVMTANAGSQRGAYESVNAGDGATDPTVGIDVEAIRFDDDEVTYRFTGKFAPDDVIVFDLDSLLDKTGEGRNATVSFESDALNGSVNDLVYVSVEGRGITATIKKVANVAEEEYTKLDKDLTIKSSVGDFVDGQWFELKLSKGFEFTNKTTSHDGGYAFGTPDGNSVFVKYIEDGGSNVDHDKFTIKANDIEIEATSAKSGATCTMTVKAVKGGGTGAEYDKDDTTPAGSFASSATVEVMKVVDYKVLLTVDEDEDVPVIYSGVNVDNYGITDDSDHLSMEVTAVESFPGAWSFRKGFNFELPEGVYVTDIKVNEIDGLLRSDVDAKDDATEVTIGNVEKAFFDAYQDGSHVNFEFKKRVFDDVDAILNKDEAKMVFQLELVADPGFEGDVVLKLTGELVDEQEVTIAKFVKPYEVKAEQNDIIIDYRYTDIPTAITITEAEKGLWAKNEAQFRFSLEKGDSSSTFMEFEDDPTFEIDSKSSLEIKDDKANNGTIRFTVKAESDEAATVTIKDMQLFMNRSIPAGPYDLYIGSSLADKYDAQLLYAPDHQTCSLAGVRSAISGHTGTNAHSYGVDSDKDCYVGEVADYSTTVKEGFVNVVTAGRDVDDASFTTKVVVPVGESYIVAGEKQVELDTPAYINAAGYTMLPIRAVATALGINNNNVLWDQPTKTVTILYGQRIITMTQGQKVVYVNGSAIPASAAVENTNSRTFLPMRDLATALGVTDITWDQATRTATLNGNQK